MFLMIFQSSMGQGKSRCGVPNGTTQGHDCPYTVTKISATTLQVVQ